MRIWIRLIFLLGLAFTAWAQSPNYTLQPLVDERAALGKVALVKGSLPSSGIQTFLLNDLTTMTPVEVGLFTREQGPELTIVAFKRGQNKALRKEKTDKEGQVTLALRTSNQACFQVQGPAQAEYQLYAWVGPELPVTLPAGPKPADNPQVSARPSPAKTQAGQGPRPDTTLERIIAGLLVAILVMLVAIFLRPGRRRAVQAAAVLLLMGGLRSLPVRAQPPGQRASDPAPRQWVTPIRPKEPGLWERTQGGVKRLNNRFEGSKLKSTLDRINKFNNGSGNLNPLNLTGTLASIIGLYPLLSHDDIAPDMAHQGWPVPPPVENNTDYTRALAEVDRIQGLLEKAYVYRQQAELEARQAMAKLQLAGSFHPLVQVGVGLAINQAATPVARMYATYDTAISQGMPKINANLVIMARSQGDAYWYPEYGLPYYLFLYQRYAIYARIL